MTGRYVKRSIEVEAVQWTRGNREEVAALLGLHPGDLNIDRGTIICGNVGIARLDYLLRFDDGSKDSIGWREFEATYEPVDQDGGDAPGDVGRYRLALEQIANLTVTIGDSVDAAIEASLIAGAALRDGGEEQVGAGDDLAAALANFVLDWWHSGIGEDGHGEEPDEADPLCGVLNVCNAIEEGRPQDISLELFSALGPPEDEDWPAALRLIDAGKAAAASTQQAVPSTPVDDPATQRERAVNELLDLAKLADDDQMRDQLESLASRFSLPPTGGSDRG